MLSEINDRISKGERALVTVLTIKFAEEVSQYLNKMGIKAHYLHSEIDTIERTEIINALRIGHIDAIVGINLLREGLDIPEVSLVAIFDADRQGFLRNERSLLQTIGRAARNSNGKVILYADSMSPPMMASIKQTLERRDRQIAHNDKNNITPVTIQKALPKMGSDIDDLIAGTAGGKRLVASKGGRKGGDWASNLKVGAGRWAPSNSVTSNISQPIEELNYSIEELKKMMHQAALELDFERAAMLRDKIHELEHK